MESVLVYKLKLVCCLCLLQKLNKTEENEGKYKVQIGWNTFLVNNV